MQATSLYSFTRISRPLSGNLFRRKAPFVSPKLLNLTTSRSYMISASKRDSDYGHHYDGKFVDENMIILRMRIHEIERNEMKSKAPPSDWMEWERNYFPNYGSDICEAVGLLQRFLMNTRPSMALGILVLLMLAMSMSMSLIVSHLLEFAKHINNLY